MNHNESEKPLIKFELAQREAGKLAHDDVLGDKKTGNTQLDLFVAMAVHLAARQAFERGFNYAKDLQGNQ